MNQEDDFAVNLNTCGMYISNWKRRYCKKNSKKELIIKTRCCHNAEQEVFWLYYLEMVVDAHTERTRITKEAFDVLTRDKSLPRQNYPGVEFCEIFKFVPSNAK